MNTLFDSSRLKLEDALELTKQSLNAYSKNYDYWAIAYSGGKDSSATVAAVSWLIETKQVKAPKKLFVLYADTRQELPPLHASAMKMLEVLKARGVETKIVLPEMDKRFMVYMLGRGVPPPNNGTLRWCTGQIKVTPMLNALEQLRAETGKKLLMLTGVRIGESAARDQRISVSCSKDGAECGQGWFQQASSDAIADTLAPLLHWRVCHVWDWLMGFGENHGLPTEDVATAYGGDEAEEANARTGCIGCPLTDKDQALDLLLEMPEWEYLNSLKRLKPLYRELRLPSNRLRKIAERNKDGNLSKAPDRMGPLTMQARKMALKRISHIQHNCNVKAVEQNRPIVNILNEEEYNRILELHDLNTWPNKWTGLEPRADKPHIPTLETALGNRFLFE